MLDEALLKNYAENFYGYGNPDAKLWFIGIEEAGGKTEQVVKDRLISWATSFQSQPIVDGYKFHQDLKDHEGRSLADRLFDRPLKVQRTWRALIKLQLAFEQQGPINRKTVRSFLKDDWCRSGSRQCLLELLPLSSPRAKTKDWPYGAWVSPESTFHERKVYVRNMLGDRQVIGPRIKRIRDLIAEHNPQIVVFYASSMKRACSRIAGFYWKDEAEDTVKNARFRFENGTLFAFIHHPNSRGLKKSYFEDVGHRLRELSDRQITRRG